MEKKPVKSDKSLHKLEIRRPVRSDNNRYSGKRPSKPDFSYPCTPRPVRPGVHFHCTQTCDACSFYTVLHGPQLSCARTCASLVNADETKRPGTWYSISQVRKVIHL